MTARLLTRSATTRISNFQRHFTCTPLTMGKQEWIAILPDNAGALEARMKIRPYVNIIGYSVVSSYS